MDDLRTEKWAVSTIIEEAKNPLTKRVSVTPPRVYYVYVLETSGFVKIGIGASPRDRLIHVQVASPFVVSLVGQHATPDQKTALRIETAAHAALEHCRVRGEWFATTPEIANATIAGLVASPPPAKARYVYSGKRWPYKDRDN